jgi:CO/xanthine dehydrogenase FAD-binding subunit
MRAFAFAQPETLQDAVAILARAPEARLLAGGTDLIIRLRDGSIATDLVVDLKRIRELDASISEMAGGLVIGARTVMTDIAADPRIQREFTALAEGAAVVGSVQIRNRATLAGNICNASPAADTVPALLVFDAVVVVAGPGGDRRIPIDDVFVRSGVTTLRPGEIVTRIELPRPAGRWGSVQLRRTRRRGHDLASVTLACAVLPSGETRLAYGSVGPRPLLVVDSSGALADPRTSEVDRSRMLDEMLAAASPSARSMRASPEYRLAMLRVLALRGIEIARARLAADGPDAEARGTDGAGIDLGGG